MSASLSQCSELDGVHKAGRNCCQLTLFITSNGFKSSIQTCIHWPAAYSPLVAGQLPCIAGRHLDSDITRGWLTNLILTHIKGETSQTVQTVRRPKQLNRANCEALHEIPDLAKLGLWCVSSTTDQQWFILSILQNLFSASTGSMIASDSNVSSCIEFHCVLRFVAVFRWLSPSRAGRKSNIVSQWYAIFCCNKFISS